jgi:hypothetical protein
MPRLAFLLLTLTLLTQARVAGAADGVVEINQARALAGGVTPGDTAGFPVSITQPGSYRLTGNLTVTAANSTAIDIPSKDVTLDLGGFTIQGPNQLVQTFPGCSVIGLGRGIHGHDAGIAVRNGRVRGMPNRGVSLDGRISRIEGVIAEENCQNGLSVGLAGLIADSQSRSNFVGIIAGNASRVRDSIADLNRSGGFEMGAASIVTGCVATSNQGPGLLFLGPGVANSIVSHGNLSQGIASAGLGVNVMNSALTSNFNFGFSTTGSKDGVGSTVFDANGSGHGNGGASIGCNDINGAPYCPPHAP